MVVTFGILQLALTARPKIPVWRSPFPIHAATNSLPGTPDHAIPLPAKPAKPQSGAFELLEIQPAGDVAMQVTVGNAGI